MLTWPAPRVASLLFALALAGLAAPAGAQPLTDAPAGASRPALTAADLVARYIAWRGGAAFERLSSIHMVLTLPGGQRRESWLARDGRSRIETDFGPAGLRQVAVAGPTGAWDVTVSGQVIQDPGGAARARRYAQLEFGDALLGVDGAKVRLSGVARVGDATWPMVEVEFDDGDADYAVIDPRSGQLWTFVMIHDGVASTEAFGDWRTVGGVRMPFYWMQQSSGARMNPTVTSVDVDQAFDPTLFREPTGIRLSSFADNAASSGWIDFEPGAGDAIYLPVRVDGRAASALLDTGASTSVVDSRLAATLTLKTVGSNPIAEAGSTAGAAEFVSGVSFDAGGLRLRGVTAATGDLATLERSAGHPLSAIIGREAFNELVVDVDFARRRVAFIDPASFVPPAGALEFPLTPDGIPLSVDGRRPALFQIDLGYTWPVEVFPAYVKAEKLSDGPRVSDSLVRGLGGESGGSVRVLSELSFAGLRLVNIPAVFAERQPRAVGPDTAGFIGIGLLSRFRLILDYPQGRLYLIPAKDAATRLFEKIPVEGFADPDPLTNPSPCKPVPSGGASPIC
jgi:hypothetical protein